MASAIPDIIDRAIALLEGSVSGLDRSISSGRFRHSVSAPVEECLSAAAGAPYPFDIRDDGEIQPLNMRTTLAATHVYHGAVVSVRVGYADRPHKRTDLLKQIARDRYEIRRCLGDPMNWLTVSSYVSSELDDGSAEYVDLGESDDKAMVILTVPIRFIYREDQS